jgi:hypothetical protein
MLRSSYSNSAYGQMRDRIAKKQKEEKAREEVRKARTPYKTLLMLGY